MTEKETYKTLMQRYWDAETTPDEERRLALYAAGTDDPDFEEIRGKSAVYLGICPSAGKRKRGRPGKFGCIPLRLSLPALS